MKLRNMLCLALLLTGMAVTGFKYHNNIATNTAGKSHQAIEGKAYWYSYYNNGVSKKLYISQVYNNNCNYCSNDITAAFKKWLILNDYENTVTSVNIDNLQDVDQTSLEKRREETIIKYKGYNYTIVKVGFTYKED